MRGGTVRLKCLGVSEVFLAQKVEITFQVEVVVVIVIQKVQRRSLFQ
jgi:hypothetical protein